MLLEALIRRGKTLGGLPDNYNKATISWVLRITEKGEFLGFEKCKTKRKILIPKPPASNQVWANTAVCNSIYTLGVGGPQHSDTYAVDRARAYRDMLKSLTHPVARAIEKFLDHPERPLIVPLRWKLDPKQQALVVGAAPVVRAQKQPALAITKFTEDSEVLGALACVLSGAKATHPNPDAEIMFSAASWTDKILVEVEGYPEWWLSSEIQTVHRNRLAVRETRVTRGDCSLCGAEDVPLARLFPKTGIGMLISFNSAAYQGYGWKQGLNAQTCTSCVSHIGKGLSNLVSEDTVNYLSGDLVACWWGEDPQVGSPWPLLQTVLDKKVTDEVREAALESLARDFPVSHLAIFSKMMSRAALYRYALISGDVLVSRLRRWLQVMGPVSVWEMSHALDLSNSDSPRGTKQAETYLLLLGGREIYPGDSHDIMSLILQGGHPFRYPNTLRRAYWHFLQDQEHSMSPNETCNYWMGFAFAKAENIQIARTHPQTTISGSYGATAATRPEIALDIISRYGPSKAIDAALTKAYEATEGQLPNLFSLRERMFFHFGFSAAKEESRANRENSDTDNTDPTDNTDETLECVA